MPPTGWHPRPDASYPGPTPSLNRPDPGARRSGLRWLLGLLLTLIALAAAWTWWAEAHPRAEREARTWVHDQLLAWFPHAMDPDDGWHGLHRRDPGLGESFQPESLDQSGQSGQPDPSDLPNPSPGAARSLVLIHGLDEPGDIWDDLAPALTAAGHAVWEYRYPNDQGIDRSADWLAELWPTLPPTPPVVLIGHSMGGLVARDFVSRWRHPVGSAPKVGGPAVAGVILVGTPNGGSEWARLRVWLEVRDHFASPAARPRDLMAGLRDGLGEAKIDLRPDSDFLRALNARPWPGEVPVYIIAGRLANLVGEEVAQLKAALIAAGVEDLAPQLDHWDAAAGDALGDGLVSLDSARLPSVPPLVLEASHRGLVRRLFGDSPEPPAIAPILAVLRQWQDEPATAPGP